MNMNKVDPDLFVICRLCIQKKGLYQIIPSIQEQIKSCYDIIVDAYDGLPQLICQECETNLRNHYETKQKYLEKQKSLKDSVISQKAGLVSLSLKAIDKQENQMAILEVNSQPDIEVKPESTKNKRLSSVTDSPTSVHLDNLSSSPSWQPMVISVPDSKVKPESTKNRKLSSVTDSPTSVHVDNLSPSTSWQSNYYKKYNCRLCSYKGKSRKYVEYHNLVHKCMKIWYADVLNRFCYVKLEKLDGEPNKTGRNDNVMLSRDRIIQSFNDYFINFTPKRRRRDYEQFIDNESSERTVPRKRKRILSNSSEDTIVIDNGGNVKENMVINTNDCIQISSDESENPEDKDIDSTVDKPIVANTSDCKTIDNISTNCYTKYLKKVENMKKAKLLGLTSNMESQLNRKVLNIGRKVLIGNYLNCMGLLRFLEYKNLPVQWVPANGSSRDSSVVIKTFLKTSTQYNAYDDSNWTYMPKTRTEVSQNPIKESDNIIEPNLNISHLDLRGLLVGTVQFPLHVKSIDLNNKDTKGKLLNANPVPNPKPSMPLKVRNELRPDITTYNEENSFSLPVITSTTSLVPSYQNNKESSDNSKPSNEVQPSVLPRIKVKAPSELMSEKALNSLAKEQALSGTSEAMSLVASTAPLTESGRLTEIQNLNIYRPSVIETFPCELTASNQNIENNLMQNNSDYQVNNVNDNYVVLDTVQLPNMKTNSPFQYFKNLLQFQNLILVDQVDDDVTKNFICLIKFKVSFNQDTTNFVKFGIQLYYHNKSFCIKVKDQNQSDIPIKTLSAEWQWEMIKTLKGDVITKVYENATKVSTDAVSDTRNFMCLLNSIQYKKE